MTLVPSSQVSSSFFRLSLISELSYFASYFVNSHFFILVMSDNAEEQSGSVTLRDDSSNSHESYNRLEERVKPAGVLGAASSLALAESLGILVRGTLLIDA